MIKLLKKYWIYIAIAVVLLVIIIAVSSKKKDSAPPTENVSTNKNPYTSTQTAIPSDGRPVLSVDDGFRVLNGMMLAADMLNGVIQPADGVYITGLSFQQVLNYAFAFRLKQDIMYGELKSLLTDAKFMRTPVDALRNGSFTNIADYVKMV